jgi:hypothetical protein
MTLQVIGAGWGRTGTKSLMDALATLGLRSHHMHEVIVHPEHSELFLAAARGRPDWPAIYGEYDATVDWPGASFWRELIDVYPDAKVLLSVRDGADWYESYMATIHDPIVSDGDDPWHTMVREVIVERDFGGNADDRDHLIEAFEQHNDDVRRTVPADRLLVFRATDGWEPLCSFLGKPVPDEPFPHVNDRASWAARAGD